MPTLDWIGKKSVVNHHNQVPFHLLKEVPELSVGSPEEGNLVVEGDNLIALKALLPYYAGQVKCIYIDPPYNTGNEDWAYNDNVNSPEIRRWLGKVVGKEMEDLSRHDKWLCMMYPRLSLLKELLREDGAIFISIDDIEVAHLRCIGNEIFGDQNFVINLIWEKKFSPQNDERHITSSHDHLLVYARNKEKWAVNLLPRNEGTNERFGNPDNDPRGPWSSGDLTSKTKAKGHSYEIVSASGKKFLPPTGRQWAPSLTTFQVLQQENRIWFGANGDRVPRQKQFLSEVQKGIVPMSIWKHVDVGHNQEAKQELNAFFDSSFEFETPKPVRLIERILQISTDKNSLVLDSFAGSGTTGHSVLNFNKHDSGNRRFILVQMPFETDKQKQKDQNMTRDITAERLRRVCKGYKKPNGETVEGLGGGFRYCKLGPSVFGADGRINPEVTFPELARHVFFTETGRPIPKQAKADSPLIGTHQDKAVYLLYNGVLKDKRPTGGNVLTQSVLDDLPNHDGAKVIYGTACRFSSSRLKREKITFKQIPYEIRIR